MSKDAAFFDVGAHDVVPQGRSGAFDVLGTSVVVFNDGGALFAVENRCPHQGTPLLGAPILSGGRIRCMMHGWLFRLNDCEDDDGLKRFSVKVDGGRLYVSSRPCPVDEPA